MATYCAGQFARTAAYTMELFMDRCNNEKFLILMYQGVDCGDRCEFHGTDA